MTNFTLHLAYYELSFSLDLDAYKFTPFDFLVRWDPLEKERYCLGFDFYTLGPTASANIAQNVMECNFGGVGLLAGNIDPADCKWRNYSPNIPLYEIGLKSILDFEGEYYPYRCVNWWSAGWENWPPSPEYLEQMR